MYKKKFEDNIYTVTGKLYHKFLESFFKYPFQKDFTVHTFGVNSLKHNFKTIFQDYDVKKWYNNDISYVSVKTTIIKWVKKWINETKLYESKYGSEKAIQINSPIHMEYFIKDEQLKILGYIDALYLQDPFNEKSQTLYLISDYKTSLKTFNTLHLDYVLQLYIYAYLLHQKNIKVEWVCIDYVHSNEKYFFRYTEDNDLKIHTLINTIWNDIKKIENDHEFIPRKINLSDYI